MKVTYDIAIVGSGVSCAYTLIHYVAKLERRHPRTPIRVAVLDRAGEFWTGIPYGARSGRDSLLISSLREFLADSREREAFSKWLAKNRDRLFDKPDAARGELTRKWLQANARAMDAGHWDELMIPRHTFGTYLRQRMDKMLRRAAAKGILKCDLIAGDATDIRRIRNSYRIEYAAGSGTRTAITAEKLVLAIGSPPNSAVRKPTSSGGTQDVCFIDNMYEPSLGASLRRIAETLKASDRRRRQVMIVGANAGTLEALYCLVNSADVNPLVSSFLIVSSGIRFPHRISRAKHAIAYTPEHLSRLVDKGAVRAKQILDAVKKDAECAAARNINMADVYSEICARVIAALDQLSLPQQHRFVTKYGTEIGKLQRRAGWEYLDVVDALVTERRLSMVQGKVSRCTAGRRGGMEVDISDAKGRRRKLKSGQIAVVISCTGFQDITKASSPLIQSLLRQKICLPNPSKRGFLINEKFEAGKNCYVMGPLVAGTLAGSVRVWHAESCSRIIALSATLAETLAESSRATPESVRASAKQAGF